MITKIMAAQRLLASPPPKGVDPKSYFSHIKDDEGRSVKTITEYAGNTWVIRNQLPVQPGVNVSRALIKAGEKFATDNGLRIKFKDAVDSADKWVHTMNIGK